MIFGHDYCVKLEQTKINGNRTQSVYYFKFQKSLETRLVGLRDGNGASRSLQRPAIGTFDAYRQFARFGLIFVTALAISTLIQSNAFAYTLNNLGEAGGWNKINKGDPITTVIDVSDYTSDVGNPDAISAALQNAYATWSSVPGATNLVFDEKIDAGGNYDAFDGNGTEWFDGTSSTLDQDANWRYANIVMGGWLAEDYFLNLGSSNILAVAWTGKLTGDGSRKPAWHSEIFFNDGFAWTTDDSCAVQDPVFGICFDIETVFLHELGHGIGFGHEENDIDSIMAPAYDGVLTVLSALDMQGAVDLYGDGGGGGGGGGNKGNNGRRPNALEADFVIVDVPEPTVLAVFGIGLLGLGFIRRQRKSV